MNTFAFKMMRQAQIGGIHLKVFIFVTIGRLVDFINSLAVLWNFWLF